MIYYIPKILFININGGFTEMKLASVSYTYKKKHVMRKVIFFMLLALLLVALVIMSISAYIGWDLSHPEKKSIPVFSSNIVPEYENISFKDINDSITLKGWFFEVKGSSKTIIFAHGYGQNRLQFGEKTLDLIKGLLNEGYNVLSFDFRNSGESEGNLTSVGAFEKFDLLGAIRYVKNKGSSHISLLGFSMGASTAIVAAAESKDVNAVIADSPYSDLTDYLNNNLSIWSDLPSFPFNYTTIIAMKIIAGIDTSKVSPVKVIKSISPTPILLIHSKDDTTISIKNSYELLGASGENTTLWETENVDHVGSFEGNEEKYMKKIIDFLRMSEMH